MADCLDLGVDRELLKTLSLEALLDGIENYVGSRTPENCMEMRMILAEITPGCSIDRCQSPLYAKIARQHFLYRFLGADIAYALSQHNPVGFLAWHRYAPI